MVIGEGLEATFLERDAAIALWTPHCHGSRRARGNEQSQAAGPDPTFPAATPPTSNHAGRYQRRPHEVGHVGDRLPQHGQCHHECDALAGHRLEQDLGAVLGDIFQAGKLNGLRLHTGW